MIENLKTKHYITIDDNRHLIKGFSEEFESATEEDILISEGGRHFELNGEINPPLRSEQGAPLYKWNGTQIIETTEEEQQAYIEALPPAPPTEAETMKQTINTLGQQLAQERLGNMQKTNVLNNLGEQLAKVKLELVQIKGGIQ